MSWRRVFQVLARGFPSARDRDPDETISRLVADNERQRALLEGRFKDAKLVDLNIQEDGSIGLDMRTNLSGVLAEWMLQAIKGVGARSYVSIEATHPEAGKLSFVIARMGGESPGARAARYEQIIKGYIDPRPWSDWHERIGPVLWWRFPIAMECRNSPPYVGTPYDSTWPGTHTHWTEFPVPRSPRSRPPQSCPLPNATAERRAETCKWPRCECLSDGSTP